jgi:ankyrin repeat protein
MKLLEAVERGDLESVVRLLAEGTGVDVRDVEIGAEAARELRRAVHQLGDLALTGRKLARTPLMLAARDGRTEIVRRLIDAGADLEAADALGRSALAAAVLEGHEETAAALLDAGARVDVKDGFSMPVLTMALVERRLGLARELFSRGAPVRPRAKGEHQPLVALLGAFPVAEAEDSMFGLPAEDEPADIAVDEGLALVRDFLAAGADATSGEALQTAVMTDLPELFDLLVDAGADPETRTGQGDTMLAWAATCRAHRILVHLLEHGADPNAAEGSILTMPMSRGDEDTVRRLLDAGADPDRAINDRGETPLMRAASGFFGNLPILRRLIAAGADLDRRDADGRTALDVAVGEGNPEAAAVLREAGAVEGAALPAAATTVEKPREQNASLDPVAERRGLHGNDSGNSWSALLVESSAAALAEALESDPAVRSVRRVAVGETPEAPWSEARWLVELAGHCWTLVAGTGPWESEAARSLSRQTGGRALVLGYNDTANATRYEIFEDGERSERFETTGEGLGEDWGPGENLDLRFESTRRNPAVDFSAYPDEDAFVDELLRELDAYAPLCWVERRTDGEEVRIALEAWPEDVVAEDTVADLRLVEYHPQGAVARWRKPDEATRSLFAAIQSRDPGAAREALAAGAATDLVPPWGVWTPLRCAGIDVDLVRCLLDGGADPDDGGEEAPLLFAAGMLALATRDALATLDLLLQAGADVGVADAHGRTALHVAAIFNLAGVKLLLRAGADPHRRDAAGRTPRQSAELAIETRSTSELRQIAELLRRAESGDAAVIETPAELIAAAGNPAEAVQEGLGLLARLGGLVERFAVKLLTKAAGALSKHSLGPPTITLEPDPEPPDEASERSARTFEGLGYVRAGAFTIPEMPGVRVLGLVHEEERLQAAVYRHPAIGRPICDVYLSTPDGGSLTVGNSPQGEQLETRPGTEKHFLPDFGAAELHQHIRWLRGERQALPVRCEGFRSDFEDAYRKDMEWRSGHGVSDDEIRRVAEAGGTPVTEDEIREVQDVLRDHGRDDA